MTGNSQAAPTTLPKLSIIIAARNEENYIGPCLEALLAQDAQADKVEVIVAANACTDATAEVAQSYAPAFADRDWQLTVLDVPTPGKLNALNAADEVAKGKALVFLDADVICDTALMGQLFHALDNDRALYATGTLAVTRAKTWVTRRYAAFWTMLPFVQGGAVGAGLFAVNRAGRARWNAFPQIISDDTYVRLQFTVDERIEVPARYHWPMIEGFSNLVRVRKRQDDGVSEIRQRYPEILKNEGKADLGKGALLRLAAKRPLAFLTYACVHFAVRMKRSSTEWTRGR